MTRAVVIGLGYFSQFHLSAWQAQGHARLVGVCDQNAALAARTGAAFGVPSDTDPAALIAATAPDIVDIVAPPPAHATLIRAALAPGRVIICQKPFCQSLDEARAVIDAAEAMGARIVVHENFRFQPWYRTVKAFLERDGLDRGGLGQVYDARFALRPGDGRGPDAYLDRQPAFQTMPRLLVHETAVHFIDLFRWMFGDVTALYADLRRLNPVIAGEDAGLLVMQHQNGVQSVFDGNRLADHATDNPRRTLGELEITGEGGTLSVDGTGTVRLRAFGARDWQDLPLTRPVDDASFGGGCVAALIDHVVAFCQTGAALENEAADYLTVMRLSETAYRSAAEGRKVTLT